MRSGVSYISNAFEELYEEDGLCVMAKGLGADAMLTKFIQWYSCPNQKQLVFCINCSDIEVLLLESLEYEGALPSEMPQFVTNDCTIEERREMYLGGGCFVITSRIFIVDLLRNIVDARRISGIIVYQAEKVTDMSTEYFILRLFRQHNSDGFIKAISQNAEGILFSQNGRVDSLMKRLYVKRLYLYPRYHHLVSRCLDALPGDQVNAATVTSIDATALASAATTTTTMEVTELSQPLTTIMKTVQGAILVAMDTCIKELKRAVPHVDFSSFLKTSNSDGKPNNPPDTSNDTAGKAAPQTKQLESALFKNFDLLLRNQLNKDWHKLSYRTKQLVEDLKTLRRLLEYLLRYDAITFYVYVQSLQHRTVASGSPSLWLTTDAAEVIFQQSKSRIYQLIPNGSKKKEVALKRQIDSSPKITLFQDIVTDLVTSSDDTSSSSPVLVIVKDGYTSSQLNDALVHGQMYVLDTKYRWFISQQCAAIRSKVRKMSQTMLRENVKSGQYKYGVQKHFPNPAVSNVSVLSSDNATTTTTSGPHSDSVAAPLEATTGSSTTSKSNALLVMDVYDVEEEDNTAESTREQVSNNAVGAKKPAPHTAAPSTSSTSAADEARSLDLNFGEYKLLTPEQRLLLQEERRLLVEEPPVSRSEGAQVKLSDNCVFPSAASGVGASTTSSEKMSHANKKQKMSTVAVDSDDDGASTTFLSLSASIWSPPPADSPFPRDTPGTASSSTPNAVPNPAPLASNVIIMTVADVLQQYYDVFSLLSPKSVILFDPVVEVVRRVEVYNNIRSQKHCQISAMSSLKVYFLMYEGSTDEHAFTASLVHEKSVFDSLIRTKATMVISLPDSDLEVWKCRMEDSKVARGGPDSRHSSSAPTTATSLTSTVDENRSKLTFASLIAAWPAVVVDIREFRSALPCLLHNGQLKIIPETITVGDYILSPEICVERKSVPDLFGSFASGRLFSQTEAMCRYYKQPTLLIEFSGENFHLQASDELPSDISVNSICSKIALLTSAFPALRILWSRSPHATCGIFRSLMTGQQPVDVKKAVMAGSLAHSEARVSDCAGDQEMGESLQHTAQELLMSLPGINVQNYRNVMSAVSTMAELSTLSESYLQSLVGPVNAKKLWNFFHQRVM